MLRLILASLVVAFTMSVAAAQEVLAPNPEIEATIAGQFEAFRAGDVPEAFTYASPNIQSLFGSAGNFGRMVQQGYPMVWNPGPIAFIDLQTFSGLIVQRVEVVDQNGDLHVLGYAMIETDNGWRINGVQVLRAPQLGV